MKLFINEFIKDYKKISTYIYLVLLVAFFGLSNSLRRYSLDVGSQSISSSEMADFVYSTFGAVAAISTIFILIMLANNIAQEFSKGTIKFLYSKPKSRSAILTSKILLAIFNFIFFVGVGFGADLLMKKYIFFRGAVNLSTIFKEVLGEEYFGKALGQHLTLAFLSFLLVAIFYIALVVLICLVFRSQVLSVIVVIFMVLGSSIINNLILLVIEKYSFLKYTFTYVGQLPYYLTEQTTQTMLQETVKLTRVDLLIMVFVYTCIFGVISYLVNAYRDINLD